MIEYQHWTHAKAWNTWKMDHNITVTSRNWGYAFKSIHDTKLPNSVKWHSSTILYRTAWTGLKQFLSSGVDNDRYCRLCDRAEDQNTKHKYFTCYIVEKLWSHVQNFLFLNFGYRLVTDINNILFHQAKFKAKIDKTRITTIICTVNFAIWKIEKDGSDPNLQDFIIWNKCKVYLNWTALVMIKLNHDISFWYKFKDILDTWNPRAHTNQVFSLPRTVGPRPYIITDLF